MLGVSVPYQATTILEPLSPPHVRLPAVARLRNHFDDDDATTTVATVATGLT